MANNKKTTTAKKAESKKSPKTPVQAPPTEQPAVNNQEQTTATTVINPEVLATTKTSGLDANHQVDLLGLMSKHFTGPTAADKYGVEVEAKMDRIVAVGIIAVIAEHAITGDSVFASIVKKEAYPMLLSVAKEMNITLPDIKALPAGKTEGTVAIPSNAVEVDAETAEQLAKEAEAEKKGDKGEIELDPVKVAHLDEEALKKALYYHFVTSPKRNKYTVKDTLTTVVDFMHDYRIEQARMAENSTDAMNKIEDRTMREWLEDITKYAEPTVIVKGIGIGLYNLTLVEQCPLSAFLTLRGALIDKETKKAVWDDESIAEATRFFIEFYCKKEIAKEQAALDALDTKAKDYKTIAAKHEEVINRHKAVMALTNDFSFDICDQYLTELPEEREKVVNNAFGRIAFQYYPECDKAVPRRKYVNLNDNLRQRAGIILNLFRSADNHNQNYSEANLLEVKEMSLEEWEALVKKEAEEAAAAKKAQSKKA